MGKIIKLDNIEYEAENLGDQAQATLASLQFVEIRLKELTNLQAVLNNSKNSYVQSLKKEIVSGKSGLLFDED